MTDNVLEIRELSKDYGDFVLDRVSFALPRGVIMGLIGENGAGKSTTINCILNETQLLQGTGYSAHQYGRPNGRIPCRKTSRRLRPYPHRRDIQSGRRTGTSAVCGVYGCIDGAGDKDPRRSDHLD